jgi:hypothetical protein
MLRAVMTPRSDRQRASRRQVAQDRVVACADTQVAGKVVECSGLGGAVGEQVEDDQPGGVPGSG